MSIQGNINQTLSIASLLLSQNPTLKAKMQQREALSDLGKREQALRSQIEVASTSKDKNAAKLVKGYQQELSGIKKQQFEAEPSPGKLSDYLGTVQSKKPRSKTSAAAASDPVSQRRNYSKKSQDAILARREELERSRILNEMIANTHKEEPWVRTMHI